MDTAVKNFRLINKLLGPYFMHSRSNVIVDLQIFIKFSLVIIFQTCYITTRVQSTHSLVSPPIIPFLIVVYKRYWRKNK